MISDTTRLVVVNATSGNKKRCSDNLAIGEFGHRTIWPSDNLAIGQFGHRTFWP